MVLAEPVTVYSRPLQLSLLQGEELHAATKTVNGGSFSPTQQRNSPSPGRKSRASSSGPDDYERMMASIMDRTQQRRTEARQDEDRRVERLLKHMAKEEQFVEDIDLFLKTRESSQTRRKQALYKEWEDKVRSLIGGRPCPLPTSPCSPRLSTLSSEAHRRPNRPPRPSNVQTRSLARCTTTSRGK